MSEQWAAGKQEPILYVLSACVNSISATLKSALSKTLHYLKQQRTYLLRHLKDERLELSNNRTERGIKHFVIGQKNFLFANTPLGTRSSALIYSLIEIAKETALDPFRYLTWLLKNAPELNCNVDGWAQPLLPAYAPADCCLPWP